MIKRKMISVLTPCYNEAENVKNLYLEVKKIFQDLGKYDYEHIFIDNCSNDRTVPILTELAKRDKNLKIIVNIRDFGQVKSPVYGLMQTSGDAAIYLVADFQDPLDLIKQFIKKWEAGFDIVIGIKKKSTENPILFLFRKFYYNLLKKLSEVDHIKNFTGFGLYDKKFIDVIRGLDDPIPYFRGLVAELGFNRTEIEYTQPKRRAGKTKNNFFLLYDIAMLGFVNHTKLPLRLASFIGFAVASISLLVAVVYFIIKLIHWNEFNAGIAPLVIGVFFFSAVQLFFIGIIGEYIGAIYTQVKKRPLVIEKDRINFN